MFCLFVNVQNVSNYSEKKYVLDVKFLPLSFLLFIYLANQIFYNAVHTVSSFVCGPFERYNLISHGLLWRALNYNFKKREIEIASPEPFRQRTIIGEILDNQSS